MDSLTIRYEHRVDLGAPQTFSLVSRDYSTNTLKKQLRCHLGSKSGRKAWVAIKNCRLSYKSSCLSKNRTFWQQKSCTCNLALALIVFSTKHNFRIGMQAFPNPFLKNEAIEPCTQGSQRTQSNNPF